MIPANYNSGIFVVLAIVPVSDDIVLTKVTAGTREHGDKHSERARNRGSQTIRHVLNKAAV